MVATHANGQPAAAAYRRDQPYGICVLTVSSAGIHRISSFGDPRLLAPFGVLNAARFLPRRGGVFVREASSPHTKEARWP